MRAYNFTSSNLGKDQPLTDPSREAENKRREGVQTARAVIGCVWPKRTLRSEIDCTLMSMTEMLQSALPEMTESPNATIDETTPECGAILMEY